MRTMQMICACLRIPAICCLEASYQPDRRYDTGCLLVGDRLLEAASVAAAKAAKAAEATRQRMQQSADAAQTGSGSPSMEAGPSNAAVNTPPTKPVRNKR